MTHGTRVNRAPRASVRATGTAKTTTRWMLSASASVSSDASQQPPALRRRGDSFTGEEHAIDRRSDEPGHGLDECVDRRACVRTGITADRWDAVSHLPRPLSPRRSAGRRARVPSARAGYPSRVRRGGHRGRSTSSVAGVIESSHGREAQRPDRVLRPLKCAAQRRQSGRADSRGVGGGDRAAGARTRQRGNLRRPRRR